MEISDLIKSARIEKGLTQQQLADVVFVTRQTISKWELGFSPMVIGVRFICCKIDKIENRKIKAVIKVIGFVVFSSYLVSLKENVAYLLIGIFSLVYLLYQFYLSGLETK